jgi:GDP-L-fucose synthase
MQTSPYKRILVTGATGFLGRHVLSTLRSELKTEIIGVGRRDFDLLIKGQADTMLETVRPDALVHLAARVGGIIADMRYPADFFYENLFINTTLFDAAYRAGVKKFLTTIGGCSYPAKAPSPIREESMWDGYPQMESAPYSIAKKVMLVQSEAYRRQHGFNSVVLIPGNIYGEYDNFNEEYSHVIPALIRRFLEAKEKGSPTITCYGSGRPMRDFVYAGDVAALIPWFLLNYDISETVNISTGTRITIRELAETVKKVTGFQGAITWDTSKPDGQMDKIFSVERLHKLGLNCPTTLQAGLRKTMDWFSRARGEGTVRL